MSQPVGPKLTKARAGIYRYDGLGGWHQSSTMHNVEELQRLTTSSTRSIEAKAPAVRFAVE